MPNDYQERLRQEARYIMLRSLTEEQGGTMVDALLEQELIAHAGIRRDRSWVQAEMRWLENVGAIRIIKAGSNLIAQLRRRGRAHVERSAYLDGVKIPLEED
jgi:hypothetical protein